LVTPGTIIDTGALAADERDEDGEPIVAKKLRLVCTLDSGTLEGIFTCAAQLEDPPSDETLLEAFVYYHRYDAFLPKLGSPPPPPADAIIRNLDRRFYESLGTEDPNKKCNRDGCGRGKVNLSAFCRAHHFENVKRKPCPFND
jgi:hypothetical protein